MFSISGIGARWQIATGVLRLSGFGDGLFKMSGFFVSVQKGIAPQQKRPEHVHRSNQEDPNKQNILHKFYGEDKIASAEQGNCGPFLTVRNLHGFCNRARK